VKSAWKGALRLKSGDRSLSEQSGIIAPRKLVFAMRAPSNFDSVSVKPSKFWSVRVAPAKLHWMQSRLAVSVIAGIPVLSVRTSPPSTAASAAVVSASSDGWGWRNTTRVAASRCQAKA